MTGYRTPWDSPPALVAPALLPEGAKPLTKPRGRRPQAVREAVAGAGASPGWLYHHLTVSGPAEPLASFVAAARGSGVVPWQHDLASIEEDVFNLAIAVPPARRNLSVEGCRILALQFRTRLEAHQARASALVGASRACPFDLHALVPAPPAILRRGPRDPQALAWCRTHWGVTDRLRHVALRPGATAGRRLARDHQVAGYGFFTDGETPHAAIAQLAPRWTALRFVLQPRPAA